MLWHLRPAKGVQLIDKTLRESGEYPFAIPCIRVIGPFRVYALVNNRGRGFRDRWLYVLDARDGSLWQSERNFLLRNLVDDLQTLLREEE